MAEAVLAAEVLDLIRKIRNRIKAIRTIESEVETISVIVDVVANIVEGFQPGNDTGQAGTAVLRKFKQILEKVAQTLTRISKTKKSWLLMMVTVNKEKKNLDKARKDLQFFITTLNLLQSVNIEEQVRRLNAAGQQQQGQVEVERDEAVPAGEIEEGVKALESAVAEGEISQEVAAEIRHALEEAKTPEDEVHALALASAIVNFLDNELINAFGASENPLLGTGRFGDVFCAKYQHTDVAIRHIKSLSPDAMEELQVAATGWLYAARHQYVQRLLGLTFLGPTNTEEAMLVMELGGLTLHEFLRDESRASPSIPHIQQVINCMAQALEFMHSNGYVHGNLKASNVFVSTLDWSAKVTDPCLHPVKRCLNISTLSHYDAPELQDAEEDPSSSSDIFSLGVILLEMLEGRIFEDVDDCATISIQSIPSSAPQHLQELLSMCLCEASFDRFSTGQVIEKLFTTTRTKPRRLKAFFPILGTTNQGRAQLLYSMLKRDVPTQHRVQAGGFFKKQESMPPNYGKTIHVNLFDCNFRMTEIRRDRVPLKLDVSGFIIVYDEQQETQTNALEYGEELHRLFPDAAIYFVGNRSVATQPALKNYSWASGMYSFDFSDKETASQFLNDILDASILSGSRLVGTAVNGARRRSSLSQFFTG